ncbi:hypothetical protein OPV22_002574 [Ensete ventricosum]|uniref:DYW domain-containing protein n=1 Tax=Ensete ventricosum TaxID=4639 RepID=A0AAV8RYG1_ENSVE|nr:hypothetical protein OPV22_002574 [Ensete ventricosum]RWV82630.1 hypothetical protein GW17_00055851 [Ensete ventricosum]
MLTRATVVAAPTVLHVTRETKHRRLLFFPRALSHELAAPVDADGGGDDEGGSAALIQALDDCRSPRTLRSLHARLLHRPRLLADPAVQIKLMRALASCGDPHGARRMFDSAPNKNAVFFNVMIRSYVNHGLHGHAFRLFADMSLRHHVRPDNYTFPCVLKACAGSDHLAGGLQLHGAVTKLGLDTNIFVGNTLIALYWRCGRLSDALRMFDEMPNKDVVSWNAMIAGYAQNGQYDRAIELCEKMVALRKPKPDAGTMASILPAMSNTNQTDIHLVRKMFDEMGKKDLVSWNAMIAIYANNSMSAEAVELFSRMEMAGFEPDAVTLASVLPACGDLSALSLGKKIHELTERKRMRPNLVLENALMDMYANCGCLEAAREVFDGMKRKDVVSWTTIISAYGMHGHGMKAISLFEQMRKSGLKPDPIAFVSILAACSHSGLLNKGKYYFKCMTECYHFVPRIEHYACMVDLLGRSGHIDEAYDFILKMSMKPNERVWGALLAACRVYSNMEIGLIAADHLFKLVPEQSGYYVLLSNIYARAGRWEDVMLVRNLMKNKGIKKLPGCSNVELWNKVHTFHIGDRLHPQSKEIYEKLDVLMRRLKELGYVAETDTALHDIEEEDKEGHLLVHSEKLAIAFVLVNTTPKTPIRITMNLRMCGDCHHAAKFISSIVEREIIIKDTNRFHHFEHGVCTCGDYW